MPWQSSLFEDTGSVWRIKMGMLSGRGCLRWGWGWGAIVSPLGRSPELPALCVSLSEGTSLKLQQEGQQREQQSFREEGGSQRKPGGFRQGESRCLPSRLVPESLWPTAGPGCLCSVTQPRVSPFLSCLSSRVPWLLLTAPDSLPFPASHQHSFSSSPQL